MYRTRLTPRGYEKQRIHAAGIIPFQLQFCNAAEQFSGLVLDMSVKRSKYNPDNSYYNPDNSYY